jgi:hypothetical protein
VSLSFVWQMIESGFPESGAGVEDAKRWLEQNPDFCPSGWIEIPGGGRARIEYPKKNAGRARRGRSEVLPGGAR